VPTNRGSVEVSIYAPIERRAFPTRLFATLFAALGSVVLHFLLLAAVVWTGGSHRHTPAPHRSTDSLGDEASAEAAMQWLTLDEGQLRDADEYQRLAAAQLAEPRLTRSHSVEDSDLVPALLEDASEQVGPEPSDRVADQGGNTRTYGLYVGQIDARIDRAWHRPRTPIGAPLFVCHAKISQDPSGNVVDLALKECNGDARWRESLRSAIRSSSPLPAPPDPAVYRRTVYLTFRSDAYGTNSPAELYESGQSAARAETAAAPDTQQRLRKFADALRQPGLNGPPQPP
jgi:hypothetical protein